MKLFDVIQELKRYDFNLQTNVKEIKKVNGDIEIKIEEKKKSFKKED